METPNGYGDVTHLYPGKTAKAWLGLEGKFTSVRPKDYVLITDPERDLRSTFLGRRTGFCFVLPKDA